MNMAIIILNIFLGIGAPLIFPIYDLIFNHKKSDNINKILGSKPEEDKKVQNSQSSNNLNVFWIELPSAFVASIIWGLTYNVETFDLLWFVIYFILIFIAIGFYIAVKKYYIGKIKIYLSIFGGILILLVFLRIFIPHPQFDKKDNQNSEVPIETTVMAEEPGA